MERFEEVLDACETLIDKNTHVDNDGNKVNDMRFGQMLANMLRKNGITTIDQLYNVEDPGFCEMVWSYPFPVKD